MTFEPFNLHADISAAIDEQGYTHATPIQEKAIPHILNRRDVLGLAQTGTGKTAAFVLPLLQQFMDGPRRRVRALVLAPTRELAAQIHEAIDSLGRHTGLRSAAIFGGVGMGPQIKALRRGVEIIVPARDGCWTTCPAGTSTCRGWRPSSSTRPTACSTWAFCPTSAG